jgi:hypothetical protein
LAVKGVAGMRLAEHHKMEQQILAVAVVDQVV